MQQGRTGVGKLSAWLSVSEWPVDVSQSLVVHAAAVQNSDDV